MRKYLIKLWKDGVRYRFLRWSVPLILSHHHVGRNGSGRKKKLEHLNIDNQISDEYRTSYQGKFPGKNMGD